MVNFNYCPGCSTELVVNDEGLKQCPKGDFVHYDNPIPVAATLVVFPDDFEQRDGNQLWLPPYATPESSLILLVQRLNEPFKGGWCLPCGFIDKNEHPKAAGAREVLEETGVITRLEQILCYCNPAPGEVNQGVIHYLGRPIGGHVAHGDDASDARLFSKDNLPEICFRSHIKVVAEWFNGDYGAITGKDLVR